VRTLEQVGGLRIDLERILVLKEIKVEELTAHVSECNTNGYEMSCRPAAAVVLVGRNSSL